MNQPDQSDSLTQALIAAVDLFEQCRISYALVGGLASMYFGRTRYTEDVDFIAQSDHEATLKQNSKAMQECGFDPSCTWKLYHNTGIEVDIWKDQFSDEMVQRAKPVKLLERTIMIVDVCDLVAMKLRAGRFQDDYDISEILKTQSLDDSIIHSRVSNEQFKHYQSIQQRLAQESGE